jgi:DNA-binding MarR family transcriptional regulator
MDHVDRIRQEWARERPDLDTRPQGVIGRLHRLGAALAEEIVAVYREHGLTEGEFDVLATLRRAGEPYERAAGTLAAHTMVTTGAISKRLDRLEAAGLVTRRTSEDDARGRVVALTPRGLEVVDSAFTAHMANEHRLMSVLTAEQADAREALLRRWLDGLDSGVPPRG